MRHTSLTFDEPVYIAAGASYWQTRDDRMNREHPPLLKMLIALPLLAQRFSVPTDDPSWRMSEEQGFADVFLSRQDGSIDRVVFLSRVPVVAMGVVLALFVRQWAAELWGNEAGLIALLLFVMEPNTIANSGVATLDLGLAAFMFISMFFVWKWLRTGRAGFAIMAGIALGCSLLAKEAALAFLPMILGQFMIDDVVASRNNLPRQVHPVKGFLQVLAGGILVLVVVYAAAFHWRPLFHAGGEHRTVEKVVGRLPVLKGAAPHLVALGERTWVPDIGNYIGGLLDQRRHVNEGHASFLMGHHAVHGWWYYYPVAFLIKTPLPILLLIIVRLVLLAAIPMGAQEYAMVFPVIGILILASFGTASSIRQILLVYPFLFVWLSRVAAQELFGSKRERPIVNEPRA
ncbi:MAG TPA: phospholipid carrier-dependent glycosyltransferase [bacterium]|nr:phospholipid carrier-dependent glycosyltransferase [bacterium]